MKNTHRIVIPKKIEFFLILWKSILDKHHADGALSPLVILNMAVAQEKYEIALQKHDEAEKLGRDAELATQLRNVYLGMEPGQVSTQPNTLIYFITSIRDILLGVYKGEEPALGKWGFEVNVNSKGAYRVKIPHRKPLPLLALAESILEKHLADGASTPLVAFDMNAFATLLAQAKSEQKKSEQLRKQKEIAYKERNNAIGIGKNLNSSVVGSLNYFVRAVRNTLSGVYRGNLKTLGDWGFEVNG